MPAPASTEAEALQRFSDEQIDRLATLCQLPSGYDRRRFRNAIRASVATFLHEKAELSPYIRRKQIERIARLVDQAERKASAFESLAREMEVLDPATRNLWASRQSVVAGRMPAWRIPEPSELRDPVLRDRATRGLKALITIGGGWVNGRWRPNLLAPRTAPGKRWPRRQPERILVMKLQVAVHLAGAPVPVTAHHDKVGPFARMAAEVLVLVGATGRATAEGLAVQCVTDLQTVRRKRLSATRPPDEVRDVSDGADSA
jgi:hypothetical protein